MLLRVFQDVSLWSCCHRLSRYPTFLRIALSLLSSKPITKKHNVFHDIFHAIPILPPSLLVPSDIFLGYRSEATTFRHATDEVKELRNGRLAMLAFSGGLIPSGYLTLQWYRWPIEKYDK